MKRTWRSLIAAGLIVAAGAAALPSAANAGWNHHNNGAAAAAGFIGLAAGAIIGSTIAKSNPYSYGRPYYGGTYYYGPPAPWTPAWYNYCSAKYNSFNPNTGYFLGYDGRYHFCQ